MTQDEYLTTLGEVRTQALLVGGEELLDQVMKDTGVASRHLERVREGILSLDQPGVLREIDESIDHARERISDAAEIESDAAD